MSAAGLGTIEMETANLSVGGAYCLSERAIPPMTRLQLNIFLPSSDGHPATLHYPIEVTAVVVRSEPLDGVVQGDAPVDGVPEPPAASRTILPGNDHPAQIAAASEPAVALITATTSDDGPDLRSLAAIDAQAEDLIAASTADVEPPPDGGSEDGKLRYRLAVFFADMAKSDRELLSRYVGAPSSS